MTEMTWDQSCAQRKRNVKVLNAFLPQTLDERKAKLADRMQQAWPTFGRCGMGGKAWDALYIEQHDSGTVVRFFDCEDPPTFHPVGAVKHGAYWWLSEPLDGLTKLTNKQMQTWLAESQLNWVVIV